MHARLMRALTTSLFDLTLGRCCAGCDRPGSMLCASCAEALRPSVRLRRDVDLNDVVEDLRIPVVCALDYRGVVRRILYRYKDHGIRQLAVAVAPALIASITYAAVRAGVSSSTVVLVPMPTRRSSIRRRGFDATALVVRRAAANVEVAGVEPILRDIRSGASAKKAGAREREHGAIDAFHIAARTHSPHAPAILVDDIVTTGATIREAASTLVLAGVHVVAVATIAGTP